jgi:chaperonin cofactor prefoldin
MNKPLLTAILIGSFCGFTLAADDPAPAEKGLDEDGPEVVQVDTDQNAPEPGKAEDPPAGDEQDLQKQIAILETEIKALHDSLKQMGDAQKELEQLKTQLANVEDENTALSTRIRTLEDENTALASRVKRLEGDNATLLERTEQVANKIGNWETQGSKTQVTAKPGFVKSAVRFHNHEGRRLQMNVNGVWHTLKEGQNEIWVPYGPVHIYRYNGAEPKLFWENWKPYGDGYIMEFDVGTPR